MVHTDDAGAVSAVSASVSAPGGSFSISMERPGVFRIDEIDRSAPWTDEVLEVPGRFLPGSSAAADPPGADALPSAPSTVDLLVVFTPAAEAGLGGRRQTLAEVDRLVAETNTAFARGLVSGRISLTAARPVSLVESSAQGGDPGMGFDLDFLRLPSDGVLDQIHVWRDALGADLVHLLGWYLDDRPCGVAYSPDSVAVFHPASALGVTSAEPRCAAAFTFVHELGHNFGLLHDRETHFGPGPGAGRRAAWKPYAYGYTNASAFDSSVSGAECWFTIMAYGQPCVDAGAPRRRIRSLLRFSDPGATRGGVALGRSGEAETGGVGGPAHAARALRESWATVAAYRSRGGAAGNRAPEVARRLPDLGFAPVGAARVELRGVFRDPDGDRLTWSAASSDVSVARTSLSGSVLDVLAGSVAGTALITVTAADPGGLTASQSFRAAVGTGNRPPRVARLLGDRAVESGGTADVPLDGAFTDPDGDRLTWTASSSAPSVVRAAVAGSVLGLSAGRTPGRASITVTAADPAGLSATQSFGVRVVRANAAPEAVQLPDQEIVPGGSVAIDLATAFTDPDGDLLAYAAASSDRGVVGAWLSAGVLTLTGESAGTAAVTLTARDPGGLEAGQRVPVVVREPPNRPPTVEGELGRRILGRDDPAVTVDAAGVFTDPDGDILAFRVSVSPADVVSASIDGGTGVVTLSPGRPGRATVTVTALDPEGLSATRTIAVRVTAPFTDPEIVPGGTPVRAVHWTQLRGRVDSLRIEAGLGPFPWTDRVLRPRVTRIRVVHLRELRTALGEVYAARGLVPARYTDPAPVAGATPVKAAHVMELRAAVRAIEAAGVER